MTAKTMVSFRCPEDIVKKLDGAKKTDIIVTALQKHLSGAPSLNFDVATHNASVKKIIIEVSQLLLAGKSKEAAIALSNNMDKLMVKEK